MNLFYFLISYAIVSVSADDEADCKMEILITNLAIKRSGLDGLERAIRTMEVNNRTFNEPFTKLNYMIALPEKTEYVIALPEIYNLDGLKKCAFWQFLFRRELVIASNLQLPIDINQRIVDPEFYNNQNFRNLVLTDLAEQRRDDVVSALINIIRRELDGPRHVNDNVYLLWMCRMLGIYMSARLPTMYIKDVYVHGQNCVLWNGNTHRRYKRIEGEWWQISLCSGKIQLLEEQLRRLNEQLIILVP